MKGILRSHTSQANPPSLLTSAAPGQGHPSTQKGRDGYLAPLRQQVLAAAGVSAAGLGFHETTLEHIREEAGLSRGAVYHYFKSKDEIIVALQEAWGEGDRLDLESAAEIDDPAASLPGLLNAVT